jgi:hypothetical protein
VTFNINRGACRILRDVNKIYSTKNIILDDMNINRDARRIFRDDNNTYRDTSRRFINDVDIN